MVNANRAGKSRSPFSRSPFGDQIVGNGLIDDGGMGFPEGVRFLPCLAYASLAIILMACGRPAPEATDDEGEPDSSDESLEVSVTETAEEVLVKQSIGDGVGVWSSVDARGVPMNLVLFGNGQAVTTRADTQQAARGGRGFWRMVGGGVIVFMADGTSIQLEETPAGVELSMASGVPGAEFPAGAPATRLGGPDAEWVGSWRLNREPDGSFLYITLRSDGTAFSSINGLTEGRWEVREGAAVCVWPDGWIDRIERASGGWLKKSWVGGVTETPADLSDAIRVGETTFMVEP
jgi:hypothetical protein